MKNKKEGLGKFPKEANVFWLYIKRWAGFRNPRWTKWDFKT